MTQVIKVEHLSKAYQLGDFGTGTISRDLERFWARLRGKEDPFLKIGEVNDRATKGTSDVVWSLKDLNFDIEQGDSVGIIGRNGAGKSTLLKILSRVTSPTTGSVKIKGRVSSLLEVGTGFHPELSGRENIYLNGTILGMRKAEIKRKFDEIVDFSGVERYIDTPVKRYSSGMYVRLAFAVAAHLESEIMIIDEVLAVGDAEFQKKCLGKMGDISRGEGRTILFVSHNLDAVSKLCNKGILLNNGTINHTGQISQTIQQYQYTAKKEALIGKVENLALNQQVTLSLFNINQTTIATHNDLAFTIKLQSISLNHIIAAALLVYDNSDQKVAFVDLRCTKLSQLSDFQNTIEINGYLKKLPLLPGVYNIGLHIQSNALYKDFFNLLSFEVLQQPLADGHLPYDIGIRGRLEISHTATIT